MESPDTYSVLIFKNGDRSFGLFLEHIREVLPAFEITPTPGISNRFVGLISLRGEVIPVLDAAVFVDNRRTQLLPQHQFIVAWEGSQGLAILVEDVQDLLEIPRSALEQNNFMAGSATGIRGVFMRGTEMVTILDLDFLLRESKADEHNEALQIHMPVGEGSLA